MEAVDRWLSSWNAGDFELHWSLFSPAAVFDDGLMPDGGVYEGRDAVRGRLEEIMALGGHWQVELDFRGENGGDLVFESHARGHAAMPWEGRNGLALRLDDEGRVTLIRWRPTVEELL